MTTGDFAVLEECRGKCATCVYSGDCRTQSNMVAAIMAGENVTFNFRTDNYDETDTETNH